MGFKMGFGCFKEVNNYLNKNNSGSVVTYSIDPSENKLYIKFVDKDMVECTITIHRDNNDGTAISFPTVTKVTRLGDAK